MQKIHRGFSLIELLTVLLITGLLLRAFSSFSTATERHQLNALAVQISRSFNLSRQLTSASQHPTTLCFANLEGECNTPPLYQIVIFNSDSILYSESLVTQIDISSKQADWQFRTDGSLITWGTIRLCSGNQELSLIINRLGRIRSSTALC